MWVTELHTVCTLSSSFAKECRDRRLPCPSSVVIINACVWWLLPPPCTSRFPGLPQMVPSIFFLYLPEETLGMSEARCFSFTHQWCQSTEVRTLTQMTENHPLLSPCPCSPMVKLLGRHVHAVERDVRSGRGSIRASTRARPPTKKRNYFK